MSAAARDRLGYAIGLLAGATGLWAFGFVDLWLGQYLSSNDFSGIWAGPRALLLGHDPYDVTTWQVTATALQGQVPQTIVYGYPGYVLVALLPLALLPLPAAALVWAVGGIAAAAAALGALLGRFLPGLPVVHGLFGVTLLLSQPAFTSFYDGQWSFVLVAACAALVLALRSGTQVAAGASAAVLLMKPHLFLFALPALAAVALARRRRRAVLIALGIGAALAAVSLVLIPHWPAAFATHAGAPRLDSGRATTLPVAAGDLAGPAGAALAWIAIGIALLAALRLRSAGNGFVAAALAASFLAAPYAWSYDQLVLLVPLAIAAGSAARRRPAHGVAVATAGCALLLVGGLLMHGLVAGPRGSESLNAFVAAAVAAVVLLAVWPERDRPA